MMYHDEPHGFDDDSHHHNNNNTFEDDHFDQEPITASEFAGDSHRSQIRSSSKSRRVWYIGGVIVVLAVIAIVLGVTLGGSNNDSSSGSKLENLPAADIEAILRTQSDTGGKELDDPTTYQYKAFVWVRDNPWESADFVMSARYRVLQRYALACVYYATYQQTNKWLDLYKEPQDRLFPWTNSKGWLVYNNECDWSGVQCNEQGYVTELDLSTNNLSGKFPAEIGYLGPALQLLNLEVNYCYNRGDSGNAFFAKLTNLEYLYMKSGLFQNDGLPTYFGLLTKLKEFDCNYGLYHGPLRPEIFNNLNELRYLEISGNAVNGTIPETLVKLPSLKYFYAADCALEGDLNFIKDMPAVVETWLDRNPGLTGPIPQDLGPKASTLESLSVTRCSLTGTLPTTLGAFENMQQMWLYYNQLTGTVPTELANLDRLKTFEIEGNSIYGDFPQELCALKAPDGYLEAVHADCEADGGDQVICSCCDCCGPSCVMLAEPESHSNARGLQLAVP